jgi:hypothetical protein
LHVLLVRFADLNYFVSQLSDAFFDGLLHDDRLALQTRWIAPRKDKFSIIDPLTGVRECKHPVATSKSSGRK